MKQLHKKAWQQVDVKPLEALAKYDTDPNVPGIVETVIKAYLDSVPVLVKTMGEAITEKKAEVIDSQAHALKSPSASVGGAKLAALCLSMEHAAKAKSWSEIEGLYPQIKESYDALILELKEILGN